MPDLSPDIEAKLLANDQALGLPPGFTKAQFTVESGLNPDAVSSKGARGWAQIMPTTQASLEQRLGRKLDPANIDDAISMHRAVMQENLGKFGNLPDALMAYNGGWDRSKWNNRETSAYPYKVLGQVGGAKSDSRPAGLALAYKSGGLMPASYGNDSDIFIDGPSAKKPESGSASFMSGSGGRDDDIFMDLPRQSQPAASAKKADPTEGNSIAENALVGIGKGFTDLALGAKQRLDDAAAYMERKFGGRSINAALGLPNAVDIQKQTQAQVDEKRALDAPLMNTVGGKFGSIGARVVPAVAASLVPGGQGLAGSIISGGVLGALEPTADDESALKNLAFGAAGGAAGYGVGKLVGKGADMLAARSQAKAAANSLVDANTVAARDAGYVIPPSQSNPNSMVANTLDILAGGRPKMAQAASLKNQGTTNALAAKALGLPENTPITMDMLKQVRSATYDQGYAPIANVGTVTPGPTYAQALDSIEEAVKGADRSFPAASHGMHAAPTASDVVDRLRVQQFDAGDALNMIQVLRDQADAAYRGGNNALGKANKQAAGALEDALDEHLSSMGATDALKAFRDARMQIAKTFTVQKALNGETGDVSAKVLAGELKKGKPLTNELLSIAKMGQLSPKNVQTMAYNTPGASQLETIGSAGAALGTGSPWMLGIPYARAGLRSMLLSHPVQSIIPQPSYGLLQNATPQMTAKVSGLLGPVGAAAGPTLLPGLLNFSQ